MRRRWTPSPLRSKMKLQLNRCFRFTGSVLPLLDGIDCRVNKQRVSTHHFHLFHESVWADDGFDLYSTGEANTPGEIWVSRCWALEGLAFFLGVANGSDHDG